MTYDAKGKPVVRVKTHGDVDVAELRRDIEQRYPGARIEGLEKKPLIRIVGEEETRRKEEKPKKARKRKGKKRIFNESGQLGKSLRLTLRKISPQFSEADLRSRLTQCSI